LPDVRYKQGKGFYQWLMHIDRRIIYAVMFIVVIVPLIWSLNLKTYRTNPTERILKRMEKNYSDAKKQGNRPKPVIISASYSGSSKPELQPMTRSIIRHCFLRGIPVITFSFETEGAKIVEDLADELAIEYGAVYGQDYVNFGWKTPPLPVLLQLGTSAREALKEDARGNKYEDIPMLQNVKTYDDIDLVFDISASASWGSWVIYAKSRYNQDVAVGLTGVMVPAAYPYLETGQLVGIISALKGAAEYEDFVAGLEKEIGYSPFREKNIRVYLTLTLSGIPPSSKVYTSTAQDLLYKTKSAEFDAKLNTFYNKAQENYYAKRFEPDIASKLTGVKDEQKAAKKQAILDFLIKSNPDKIKEFDYMFMNEFKKREKTLLQGCTSEDKRAMVGMDAQAIAHVTIILFILIGNIGFFLSKWRR
jgi:hypothetical protein